MEFKKRKADLQLTAENYEDEASTSYGEVGTTKTETGSGVPESKVDEAASTEEVKPVTAPVLGGFSSYAKTNPFAQAMANSSKNAFASTPVSSFGAISASKSNFNMPPPLVLPSPKSPKTNPFSSPSPANTQFVTIVDNNDLLWKTMANDKLSADETAKSNTFQDNKTTSFRSAFFGGNSHNSSFASVTANATSNISTTPSVFGSSTSTSAASSSGALAVQSVFGQSAQDDDAGDDENDDENDNNNDGDASPSAQGAGQASMKIISLPENVKLVTGEEEDVCLLQFRAKLYRLNTGAPAVSAVAVAVTGSSADSTDATTATTSAETSSTPSVGALLSHQLSSYEDNTATANSVLESVIQEKESKSKNSAKNGTAKAAEWVEVGIGPLKILSSKTSGDSNNSGEGVSSGRLVMRREDKQNGLGTKLLLNVRLNRLLKVTRQSDKMVQLVCVNYADLQNNAAAAATIGTYLVKTKTTEEADDIFEIATDFVTKSIAADEAQSAEDAPTDEQA